jgi:hypothetical protein
LPTRRIWQIVARNAGGTRRACLVIYDSLATPNSNIVIYASVLQRSPCTGLGPGKRPDVAQWNQARHRDNGFASTNNALAAPIGSSM